MLRSALVVSLLLCFIGTAFAQVAARRPVVRASGTGVVSIKPDQARVTVSVMTTGDTAAEAGDSNATITTNVIAALRQLLGASADIRTLNYSLSQLRDRNGQPIGFTVTNSVQVTSNDIDAVGRMIDTASAAGATSIGGVSFSLRDSQPARLQALRLASIQAKTSAEAIASGFGLHVGNIVIAEQGTSISTTDLRGTVPATPIEVGNLDVTANVAIEAELSP